MQKFKLQLFIIIALQIFSLSGCEDNISGPSENNYLYGQIISEWSAFAILKPDGTIWTWGPHNICGTLGNGTTNPETYPKKIGILENIVAMDFYSGAAFAVDKGGNIYFWGNYITYFGLPGVDTNVTTPIKIAVLKNVIDISVWGPIVHLLKSDGTVWYLIMELEEPKLKYGPEKYRNVNNIIDIHNYYALKSDGNIISLGSNAIEDSSRNIIGFQSVPSRRKVYLKKDGTVWAAGKNDLGQLGNGTFEDSETPVQVKNLKDIIAISANYDYNLALKNDGTVWFWGFAGKQGEILHGISIPEKIQELEDVVLIHAYAQCIVMKKDGTYFTFSTNDRKVKRVIF